MASLKSTVSKPKTYNYFGKQIWALKICGVSLTGNESVSYRLYSYLVLFFISFGYTLLYTYEITKHDFDIIADYLTYQVGCIIASSKILVLLLNRVKLRNLLEKLEKTPFTPNLERGGDVEEKLVAECVWFTNLQSYVYWIPSCFTVCATILYTLVKRISSSDYHDWQFSYGPLTVLNITRSPNFEISMMYQNISFVYLSSCFCSTDLLLSAVLAHITYQFKILRNYIKNLVQCSYKEMLKDVANDKHLNNPVFIPYKYLEKSLKNAVSYHLAILEIAKEVEEVFSYLLLSTFLCTLGLLCFLSYRASEINSTADVARHIVEMGAGCFQILVVCYWGEQVVYESQQVGPAAYKADFVGTDLRFQKALSLIIRRSQNPSKLTAGKFIDISLPTFVWILRTSYTAFMVLRSTNEH